MRNRSKMVMAGLTMGGLLLAVGCSRKLEVTAAAVEDPPAATIEYPETPRVDHVDTYHGVEVADPYRWLEADVRESSEVAAWVEAQNAVARAYLDAIPQRPAIHRRLTELWNYERYSLPQQEGGRYFYLKNDGLQNQSVLYVADAYDADGRVLVDPNEWSEDGTIAMSAFAPSDDGRYLAYSRSEAGSDWQQIHVLEVDTGEHLDDRLEWVRFAGIRWTKDGSGFYYNRYPPPEPGQEYQSVALDQKAYFHRLGTSQEEDELIYHRPDQPEWTFSVVPTDDGQHLILTISSGTDPQNQVHVREATAAADAPWTELIGDFDNQFWFVGSEGSRFFFHTDLDAPTKRVVAMDLDRPGREHLTEVIAARQATLQSASLLSGRLITRYLEDVQPLVEVFDLAGEAVDRVEFPGLGAVSGFGGSQDDTETFYSFASYNTPPRIYRYDLTTSESQLIRETKLDIDPAKYTVEQVFATSKDGTRVPIFLAYRTNLPSDRPLPTLLYAYGGFSISILPQFSTDYLAWLEMGGVLAVANLRGGGEYGEEWHVAGKILDKQNVFDDFIAAAEFLIDGGRTSTEQLAIMGGSNGGLLVGAVMTQRPELFGACIPNVGVMDMLRFHLFTAGQFWRDEYGSSEDPQQFEALFAYSPYHNIREETEYPPTLVMTADTDDRVVPMHSFKFAAALQHAQAGDAPILLRVETRAGHGRGTPVAKLIDLAADRWAFLVKTFQMDVPAEE